MKISIITPALNAADTICDTIASVIDQTYNNIEYILVDCGSTDETLAIFLSMRHSMDINRTKHISVETKDVYNAIEKGVECATGDIIAILGAGDFYSSDDVVSTVMGEFDTGNRQMVYGDMKFVDYDNTLKVTRRTCGRFYRRWPKTSGMTKCHPALFMTKDLFLKSGGYRPEFKLAADYEMMVRLLSERDHGRKYLRKEMLSIRQDKVNSAEAEAYRKELVKAYAVNDHSKSEKDTVVASTDTEKSSTAIASTEVSSKAGKESKKPAESKPKPSYRRKAKKTLKGSAKETIMVSGKKTLQTETPGKAISNFQESANSSKHIENGKSSKGKKRSNKSKTNSPTAVTIGSNHRQ